MVTVHLPGCSPLVSMLAVTTPLPSGPDGATGCEEPPGPGRPMVAVTVSQVCPGTVEFGSANGPVAETPNWPGSGRNTPNPSFTVVPFGVLPGMNPLPVIVIVCPSVTPGRTC